MSAVASEVSGVPYHVYCLQVTLSSAKVVHDVGGDAEKRILARMRELEERSDPADTMRNGKQPPQNTT